MLYICIFYFTASDEEDSASAHLPDRQNHHTSPDLPNGTKDSPSSIRYCSLSFLHEVIFEIVFRFMIVRVLHNL